MDDHRKTIAKNLAQIIAKAMQDKIYGSVEVYFEAGNVTQISQRIINKITHKHRGANGDVTRETTKEQQTETTTRIKSTNTL